MAFRARQLEAKADMKRKPLTAEAAELEREAFEFAEETAEVHRHRAYHSGVAVLQGACTSECTI